MLDKVKEHSEAMSKLAENYPVAIITGNNSGLCYSDAEFESEALPDRKQDCLDFLKGSEVYLLSSANKGLLISEEELKAFISGLGKRFEKAGEHIASLSERLLKAMDLMKLILIMYMKKSLKLRLYHLRNQNMIQNRLYKN